MIVDSVMRRAVVTLAPTASAREAAALMTARRIGSVIVSDGARPLGIVTERDLVGRVLAAGRDPAATLLRDIMSAPLATIEPSAPVDEAAEKMRTLRVKRLVVVLDGQVRGVVTTTDIAYARPELSRHFVEGWMKATWEG